MRVYVEADFFSPAIEVDDILVFQCGCACSVEALSHPGIENSLGYHMRSVCSLQELELGITYDTDTFDISGGYENIYTEIAYSHRLSQEEAQAQLEMLNRIPKD